MPTNPLSPDEMKKILHEQFSEVASLGFTAEGICKIPTLKPVTETTFSRAAAAISQSSELIKDILRNCPRLRIKNLEQITARTGGSCADIIKKLHDHRGAINELTAKNRFSATNMSGMLYGSASSILIGIRALTNNKEALFKLVDNPGGFSPSNISNMLGSGSYLHLAIEELLNTKDLAIDLMNPQTGLSASNISSMLTRSRHKIGLAIRSLHAVKPLLQELIRSHGFSPRNLSYILHGSRANVGLAIIHLYAGREVLSHVMSLCGFSSQHISSILATSGAKVKEAIDGLYKNSPLLSQLIQSGTFTATELAFELRNSGEKISEAIQNNPKIAKAIEDIFFDDLSYLLFSDQIEGILGPGIEALVDHRATLLQLKQVCGFSANNIAGMLKGSEADLGPAIGELNRKKEVLFGLINVGLFTADELAEKLDGSGVYLGEVFDRNLDIRRALHAPHWNTQANAPVQQDNWLDGQKFFEVDDSDIPVFSPASKRPRFA